MSNAITKSDEIRHLSMRLAELECRYKTLECQNRVYRDKIKHLERKVRSAASHSHTSEKMCELLHGL